MATELKDYRVNLTFHGTAELKATSQEEADEIAVLLALAVCGTKPNHDGAVLMHEHLDLEYAQAKHYDEIRMGGIWHATDHDSHDRKFQRPQLDGQELDRVGFGHGDNSEEPPDGIGG